MTLSSENESRGNSTKKVIEAAEELKKDSVNQNNIM
jgi:hypothetical protein